MKKRFIFLAAGLILLVSCSREEKTIQPALESKSTIPPILAETKVSPTQTDSFPMIMPSFTPTVEFLPPTESATQEKWISDDMGPIAFINDDGIFLINGDGYFVSQVYKNPNKSLSLGYEISWSPDGKSMAFFGNSYSDIYLVDVSSGVAKKLNDDRLSSERDPAFSPDSQMIVFVSDKDGGGTGKLNMSLYVMNHDGSNVQRIYKNPDGRCAEPDWTSNGNRIVFTDYGDIYSIKADGSDLKNLTNGKGYNYSPVWSPDGAKIAFIRKNDVKEEAGYLYTMNFDGTGLRSHTTDDGIATDVGSWSPDGRFIAFKYVTWNGPLAIYISDTTNIKIKMISGSDKFDPTWYPLLTETYKPEDIIAQPDCTNGWSKLVAGEKARILGDSYASPNRVRSGPSRSDAVIGEIKSQTVVPVLQGPVCADGLVFWRIFTPLIEGNYGWTAEGNGQEYYLTPE